MPEKQSMGGSQGSYHSFMNSRTSQMLSQFDQITDDEGFDKVDAFICHQFDVRFKKNDIVTAHDVMDILSMLGLNYEHESIRLIINEWPDGITEDNMLDLYVRLQEEQQLDIRFVLHNINKNKVVLGPLQYFQHVAPCFTPDPDLEYKDVQLRIKFTPRQLLFLSTGSILLLTGMGIVLLMALLWMEQAETRENVQLRNFHKMQASFIESFEANFIAVHGDSMKDEVSSITRIVDKQFLNEEHEIEVGLREDAVLMSRILDTTGDEAEEKNLARLKGFFSVINTHFSLAAQPTENGFDLSHLLTLVDDISRDPDFSHVDFYVVQRSSLQPLSVVPAAPSAISKILRASTQPECAYGPCDYDAVQCLQPDYSATTDAEFELPKTFLHMPDLHRKEVDGLGVTLKNFNVSVCGTLSSQFVREQRLHILSETILEWNRIYKVTHTQRKEILLVQLPENWQSGEPAVFVSGLVRKMHSCYSNKTCLGMDQLAAAALLNDKPQYVIDNGYSGERLIMAAAPTKHDRIVVVFSVPEEGVIEEAIHEVEEIIDHLNLHRGDREASIVVAKIDKATGGVIAQDNAFASTDCLGECRRRDAAKQAAELGFATKRNGWLLQPDYRPEPVLASYSYVENLNIVVYIERGIESLRHDALDTFNDIVNENNKHQHGTIETMMVHLEGDAHMRTFDRYESCDHVRECTVLPNEGTIYRSDCTHCLREVLPRPTGLRFLTKLRFQEECDAVRNCSKEALLDYDGLGRRPLIERNVEVVDVITTDYRDQNVMAVYSYVQNLSSGLIVKLDREEISKPIRDKIGLAAGIAILIVVVGLVALIIFSGTVLDKIEREWLVYKDQIETEKASFNNMVNAIVPAGLKQRLQTTGKKGMKGEMMTVIFVDICGASERCKTWEPAQVCRLMTYYFTCIDTCAEYYNVKKLRFFGDTYCGVGGLPENDSKAQLPGSPKSPNKNGTTNGSPNGATLQSEQTMMMNGGHTTKAEGESIVKVASLGSALIQLFGPRYAHYPDTIEHIRETFSEYVAKHGPQMPDVHGIAEDYGHVSMPPIRVGLHTGPAVVAVIETGRTSMFDIFGASMALGARMQATSQPGKMHITEDVKDGLDDYDFARQFQFDAPRKTVVRGAGTVTSYFVTSTSVTPPDEVLMKLGIKHANLRVFYQQGENRLTEDAENE